ncbi:MAG TPA: type II secretion system F family protein [Actinomycetota bacterium]|nr:type II secretion system F family protein [Actinomycetota bacterium]
MRYFVVLVGALGSFLVYSGLVDPEPQRRRSPFAWVGDRYGIPATRVPVLLMAAVASGATATMLVGALTPVFAAALVAGLAASAAPGVVLRTRMQRRREAFSDAWPHAIGTLRAMLRSGASLGDALASLADHGPDVLRPAFAAFGRSYRTSGDIGMALEQLRLELADPVADKVVATIELARDVGGGDVVRVLGTLSDFVRDDLRVRREIAARWSWTVTAARLAAGAPWFVLLVTCTKPEAASAYASAVGTMTLIGGAAATFIGYRLMLRAARLPQPRRLQR